MIILYQFPISHYCEKARWALDYKGLEYRTCNLLPGLHARKTKKLGDRSSVPLLVDGDAVIQGSSDIISYLDAKFPANSLTPAEEQGQIALEWEKFVDEEVGIHVRRCCYNILLDHPDIVVAFFSQDGPWYGKFLIRQMFPKLRTGMRERMKITEESAQESRQKLGLAVDKLNRQLQEKKYLVGDQFSRADLAAASLLAPLRMPQKYGLTWPRKIPVKLQALFDEFEDRITWVDRLYEQHR